jgi:S1-C subfamily serine protease
MTELHHISSALAGVVAKASPSVVSVHSHKSRSTGFVWRPGLIVTADEALADEGEVRVMSPDGRQAAARIVGRDASTDVALLRIDGATSQQPVVLSTSIPSAGALVVTVGADHGMPTAALGIVSTVSGPWRSMRGGEIDTRLELDVRLRRSSDGALAVDASGQAFGMAVRGPRRSVLVIPAATIERIAARLESDGRIPRGYLGLAMQPVSAEGGGAGVMVMSVDATGPAAAAGLHQGDVIVGWNGAPIERFRPLIRSLGPNSVGQTLALEILRGGKRQKVELKIGERPSA